MSDIELPSDAPEAGITESDSEISSDGLTSDDIGAIFDTLEGAPADASSAAAPETPEPARAADAIVPPAVTAQPALDAGPVPPDRHIAAVNNAREKGREQARRELEAEYRQKYGDPNQLEQSSRLQQWLDRDPHKFLEILSQQLQQRPQGPPEPDLKSEDGQHVYSAPQLTKLLEYQQRKLLEQVKQEYGPVVATYQQQKLDGEAQRGASTLVQNARENWLMFRDLELDVKARMTADTRINIWDAYAASLRERGPALMQERWKADQAKALAEKSAAVTTKPGARPATPRDARNMSMDEVMEDVFQILERK